MARIDVLLFPEESIFGSVLGAILGPCRHKYGTFRVPDGHSKKESKNGLVKLA